MPPIRPDPGGRASKACTTCRRQKTRCYEGSENSSGSGSGNGGRRRGACLRCETLRHPCSLEQDKYVTRPAVSGHRHQQLQQHPVGSHHEDQGRSSSTTDERLACLEGTVSRLVERLDAAAEGPQASGVRPPPTISTNAVATTVQPLPISAAAAAAASATRISSSSIGGGDAGAPPVLLIRDVATEVFGVESGGHHHQSTAATGDQHRQSQQHLNKRLPSSNIIDDELITPEDAEMLLAMFQIHYGRWVAFDEDENVERLMPQVRTSPLLLCSVCLIAVRHTTQALATRLAPVLFEKAKTLVSAGLLTTMQTIEFFQSAIMLSMWSTTVGQVPLGVDSWLLTGFALQHALANPLFEHVHLVAGGKAMVCSREEMKRWRIWNHLCLVHLHYCVGTRRTPMLNRTHIDQCRQILDWDSTTNFETRMVAEVELYWIIYGKCTNAPINLPEVQDCLNRWKKEWTILFDQPRSQFLQLGYHFAQLLAFGQSLKSGTAAMKESLLSEMIRLCNTILNLAIETTDDRTQHLTDHIYHIITFAAITLCRLLNSYETQLQALHNVPDLDILVRQLVDWLRSIGLPCHVASTLGNIVSALHSKLRPEAHLAAYAFSDGGQSIDTEIARMFPDLLASEFYDVHNGEMWPDWEAYG